MIKLEKDGTEALTMEEWDKQIAFDKKDAMGISLMLNQARSAIRYRQFKDAEDIVKDLQDTCKTRLWPGSIMANVPSVTMDFPSILCPEAKNEILIIPELAGLQTSDNEQTKKNWIQKLFAKIRS